MREEMPVKTSRRRTTRWFGAACVLLLLSVVPAAAQVADATIEATVSDENDQALPGVTVRATGTETGLRG